MPASGHSAKKMNECLTINRKRIVTPAGIELTLEAEKKVRIEKGHNILSVGCGTGEIESYLAQKYGSRVTGIDINSGCISAARKVNLPNLVFEEGDGQNLRFDDDYFDIVYLSGSLGGFFDRGLSESRRVLKKGGKVILIEVVYMGHPIPKGVWNIWANREIKVMTKEGLIWEFEKSGFRELYKRVYYEPAWWEIYYAERGNDPDWNEERENYLKYREYIGIGLFIFEKCNQAVCENYNI